MQVVQDSALSFPFSLKPSTWTVSILSTKSVRKKRKGDVQIIQDCSFLETSAGGGGEGGGI